MTTRVSVSLNDRKFCLVDSVRPDVFSIINRFLDVSPEGLTNRSGAAWRLPGHGGNWVDLAVEG